MLINKDVLFRRRGAVVVPVSEALEQKAARIEAGTSKESLVVTASMNLGKLGYRFSGEFVTAALDSKLPISGLAEYLSEVISTVKVAVGAHKTYRPMYPNFPAQVADAHTIELYVNAMIHYWGDIVDFHIMPSYTTDARAALGAPEISELTELRVIGVTKRGLSYKNAVSEFDSIFSSLLSMKSSWGEAELDDAAWFVSHRDSETLDALIPEVIPNKENFAALATIAHNDGNDSLFGVLLSRASTATDVLRIAVALSGGNVTLSGIGVTPTRFRSQPKSIRRLLVGRLESLSGGNVDKLVEDMLRNRALWKLLAHSLHIGEYASKFPTAVLAAGVIRANGKNSDGSHFATFGTTIEVLIRTAELNQGGKTEDNAVESLVSLLSSRPGVFARRLDKVVRIATDKNFVIDAFESVAGLVATPVLWQLRNFYKNRALVSGNAPQMSRVFIPKGSAAKMMEASSVLPDLDDAVVTRVIAVIDAALSGIYAQRESLGKVFISDELKNYTVPFGARSASKALNPVGRGTRIPIGESSDTLRFFIWWTDGDSRTDIDLSAMFLQDDFTPDGAVAYYHLRDEGAVHSGDITSAPHGASEFIDINRKQLLRSGRRYVAMVITSYTGQPFDTLPEVFAGVMERSGAQSGEVYEPRTVHNAFDVTAPSLMSIPLIIDLADSSFIWADLASGHNAMYATNVGNNENILGRTVRGLVESTMVSLHDVFTANAIRGEVVDSPEGADSVIEINRGRVVINGEVVGTDRILSEWI